MQFFKTTICQYTLPEVVQSWFEEHEDALQHLLWLAVTQLKYRITLVSCREQCEKQIPSIISHTTRRRIQDVLQSMVAQHTAVSIIFVHLLYMLRSYIP
jgi:hypothetical protein